MKTCCFVGDRKFKRVEHIFKPIYVIVEQLIDRGYDTFLFANNSEFEAAAIEVFEVLKSRYHRIKRILIPSTQMEYDFYYTKYTTRFFDQVLDKQSSPVLRDKMMIDLSQTCIFYVDMQEEINPPKCLSMQKIKTKIL